MQVKQFYSKNQFIIDDDIHKTITFQSYESQIATLDKNNNILTIYSDYNYSQTTSKYFYKFIDEYIPQIKLDNTKDKQKQIQKLFNTTTNNLKIIYNNN